MDSLIAACIRFPFDLFKEYVLKHLCFVVQVSGNVEALGRRAGSLEARRLDVLERIQADEPAGKKPTHEVGAWLRDAEAVHQRAQSIRVDYDSMNCVFPSSCSCSCSCSLNCFSNHDIGRRAAEELSNVESALQNSVAVVGEITTAGVPLRRKRSQPPLSPRPVDLRSEGSCRRRSIYSHPLIPKLADEVADECGGLPLALITIGRALARNRTVQVWQNAARLLRDSKLSKIPGTVDPLPLLKFSYDHLKSHAEQHCFLHCALWPEDCEIDKDDLIECWMGHGLLGDDVDEMHDVYNQGYAIIDSLLKACLLRSVEPDDGQLKNQFVKLHDVIRDMALWIARDCGENENKWMMLKGGERLPHDTRVWSDVHKIALC